jgi:hypothetical protein
LPTTPAPDAFGVFQGLESARTALVARESLAELSLAVELDAPLPLHVSPFSNPVDLLGFGRQLV